MNVKVLHTNNNFFSFQRGVKAALIATFLMVTFSSNAQTNYYVNDGSITADVFTSAVGNNSNNGDSPLMPKATLTNILTTYGPSGANVLTSGDTIFIDAGNYFETDENLTISTNGISIVGAGTQITEFDNNAASANANRLMTITGDDVYLSGFAVTGYNRSSEGIALQFDGVSNNIIDNVWVYGNFPGGGDAGIVVEGGSQVTFNGGGSSCNPAASSLAGGGVNVVGNGNQVTFNNYGFSNNSKSVQPGSGLYVNGDNTTSIVINSSVFSDNVNSGGVGGGAIYAINGAVIDIDGSCFNNNEASGYGGAILIAEDCSVSISDCSFNSNTSTGEDGGAIATNTSGSDAFIDIVNCSFTNNSAPSGFTADGADIFSRGSFSSGGIITAFECTWSGTSNDVFRDDGSITLENSGSPANTGVVFTNTIVSSIPPSTACPVMVDACRSSPLPVELLNFSGDCSASGNLLMWSTASEKNNDRFVIKRSEDGYNYGEIGVVNGQGNTQELSEYSFKDYDAARGIVYYKLMQFDYDGKSETFDIIAVENDCLEGEQLTAHYSNASQKIKLFHEYDSRDIISASLFSVGGRKVFGETDHSTIHLGYSEIALIKELVDGIYIIQLQTIDGVKNAKIIIQ